jgi:hypothetical protein
MSDPPPVEISLSPTNGFGSNANFQMVSRDFGGAGNISVAQLVVSPSSGLTSTGACHVQYQSGQLFLDGDGGNFFWIDSSFIGGGGHTMQNSQCFVFAGSASVSMFGTDLTVVVPIQFKSGSFSGTRFLFTSATNTAGNSPWTSFGSWQVP